MRYFRLMIAALALCAAATPVLPQATNAPLTQEEASRLSQKALIDRALGQLTAIFSKAEISTWIPPNGFMSGVNLVEESKALGTSLCSYNVMRIDLRPIEPKQENTQYRAVSASIDERYFVADANLSEQSRSDLYRQALADKCKNARPGHSSFAADSAGVANEGVKLLETAIAAAKSGNGIKVRIRCASRDKICRDPMKDLALVAWDGIQSIHLCSREHGTLDDKECLLVRAENRHPPDSSSGYFAWSIRLAATSGGGLNVTLTSVPEPVI